MEKIDGWAGLSYVSYIVQVYYINWTCCAYFSPPLEKCCSCDLEALTIEQHLLRWAQGKGTCIYNVLMTDVLHMCIHSDNVLCITYIHICTCTCIYLQVDLQCVSATSGGYYYPDHLPILGNPVPSSHSLMLLMIHCSPQEPRMSLHKHMHCVRGMGLEWNWIRSSSEWLRKTTAGGVTRWQRYTHVYMYMYPHTCMYMYMYDGTYKVTLKIVKAGCHPVAIAQVVEH